MLPSPQLLNQVESFIKSNKNQNYYCLFLLGKEAGLRVSEAVNFDLNLKRSQNLYLISGKRHKKRNVFIDPQIISTLKENHWKSQQTNRFSYAHYLQKVKKELNIGKEIELTPHTLRRCFATYQAINGTPLPILQKVLGHSSIRTTALYWKDTADPDEKIISDKWLTGKLPPESPKPTENKLKGLPKLPARIDNGGKIFLNIYQQTNIFLPEPTINLELERQNKLLKTAFKSQRKWNKNLREKLRQLKQEKKEQKQIIINLRKDKAVLKKQLLQVQKEKDILLKLLAADLKRQQKLTTHSPVKQNIPELHQELIAQIEVLTKNS